MTTWQATVKDDRLPVVILETLSSKAAAFNEQFDKLGTDCSHMESVIEIHPWILNKVSKFVWEGLITMRNPFDIFTLHH